MLCENREDTLFCIIINLGSTTCFSIWVMDSKYDSNFIEVVDYVTRDTLEIELGEVMALIKQSSML